MKNRRFQYKYRKSASSLHKIVGDFLRESDLFKNYDIYQEYPVYLINSSLKNKRLKYDWVIPKLKIVTEVHGKQHFFPCNFSGKKEEEEVWSDFIKLKERDLVKKKAALMEGFYYIEIPYNEIENISDEYFLQIISKPAETMDFEELNWNIDKERECIDKARDYKKEQYQKYKNSEQYKTKLEKNRQYRKEQYRRIKELKDGSSN